MFRVDLSIKDCLLSIGPAILRGHFCGHLGPAGHWAIWVLLVIGLMLDSIEWSKENVIVPFWQKVWWMMTGEWWPVRPEILLTIRRTEHIQEGSRLWSGIHTGNLKPQFHGLPYDCLVCLLATVGIGMVKIVFRRQAFFFFYFVENSSKRLPFWHCPAFGYVLYLNGGLVFVRKAVIATLFTACPVPGYT